MHSKHGVGVSAGKDWENLMAITTIKNEMTWDGKVGDMLAKTSEKKIKQTLKDMTGAVDVEILGVDSWDEDENDDA